MNIYGFGLIDILIVAILLISLFIGFKEGFIEKFFRLIRKFAALVVSILLAKPASVILANSTTIDDGVAKKVVDWLLKRGDIFAQPINPATKETVIDEALAKLSLLPKFIIDSLKGKIMEVMVVDGETTVGNVVAQPLTSLVMFVIAFIGLFIATLIAVWILKHIFKALTKNRIIGGFDRLLGGALGIVEGAILVFLMLILVNYLLNSRMIPQISDFLYVDLKVQSQEFSLARYLSDNNILYKLIVTYIL